MKTTKRLTLLTLFAFFLLPFVASAQERSQSKTIRGRTEGLQKLDGFMPLYWDAEGGKLLMEISRFSTELLYQVSLPTGIGSNPIGLDRGQLGNTHVVFFERVGPKVLMVEPNYRFRAITNDAAERRAVEESFARSVLYGFKVEVAEEGRVLVDATAFFLRDEHGVIDRLRDTEQGRFSLDESRSAIYLPRTKNFPKNTEVEATLTFAADQPGALVRDTAPTAQSLT
ncbi:MAG: DUF5117 domain-containing protein, partial [Pyrinomonadaceae bacterium]|nr:DUF5117 domain-containing protein [Pyrinomonadaceae bacterium]